MTVATTAKQKYKLIADAESRLGYLHFLSYFVVNSQPKRQRFGLIAEEWQRDREVSRAGSIDSLCGLNDYYTGFRRFASFCAKGNDKSTGVGRRLLYMLAYSTRPLQLYICSGKEEQAAIVTAAMKMELDANAWLRDKVEVSAFSGSGASGSELHVIPMKAATGQGIFPDYLFADEITHWEHGAGEEFWDFIVGSINKRPQCVFEIASNAGYKGSWQWRIRNEIAKSPRWDYFEQAEWSRLAGWMDEAAIAEDSKLMSQGERDRLHGNRWIDPGEERGYLTLADAEGCVDPDLTERTKGEPNLRYWAIVDYGTGMVERNRDRCALCVMHNVPGTDEVVIDRLDCWEERTPGQRIAIDIPEDDSTVRSVEGWIEITRRNFKILGLILDPWQMESLAQKYQRKNVRVERFEFRAGKKNMRLAELLRTMVQNRKITWSKDAGLLEGADDDTFAKELARLIKKKMIYGYRFDHESGAHDDRCLVSGTMVDTARGPVEIENVVEGDFVLTSGGYREVLGSGRTGFEETVTVEFSNGSFLTGTRDHPVLTDSGWVPLAELREDHTVYTWSKQQNTTVEPTAVTRNRSVGITEFTSRGESRKEFDTCIGICGKTLTGQFRRDGTFITPTMTRTTTYSRTLSVSATGSITRNTDQRISPSEGRGSKLKRESRIRERTEIALERWLKTLIANRSDRQRQERRGSAESELRSNAPCAKSSSIRRFPTEQSTALTLAACAPSTTQRDSLTKFAPRAGRRSGLTSTIPVRLARVSVLGVCESKRSDVFNLTVDELPEFFANGILVHNSACVGMGLTFCVPEARPGGKTGPSVVAPDPVEEMPRKQPLPVPHRGWAEQRGLYGMGGLR